MLTWITLHALEIPLYLAAVTALARILYALVARLVAPYPRLRAAVEALAAASPDVLRGLAQLYRVVTGRDLPMPLVDARDAELARLRDQLAVAQGERIELRARLAELVTTASAAVPPPPGTRPTSLPPPPGIGMMVMFALAVMLGCAGRMPGDPGMAAAKIVLATTTEVRNGLCDRAFFGPPPPLDVDNAPRDLAGVVGQVRAWLCADALGALLDLARELATPRPAASDAPTAATPPPAPEPSPEHSGDAGPTPTAATADAGTVTP